jgi:hypothetical protein
VIKASISKNFNRIFILNSIFLVALIGGISNFDIEVDTREKLEQLATLFPLFAVIATVHFTLKFSIHSKTLALLDCLIALVVVFEILFFTAIRRPFTGIPRAWSGFGRLYGIVLLVALIGILLFPKLKSRICENPKSLEATKRIIGVLSALIAVLYVPSLIQVPQGFTNFGDSTYFVLEESLAQTVGFIPYVNFTPIYTASFGWFIAAVSFLGVPSSQLFWITTMLINVLIAWSLVKTASILKKISPSVPHSMIFVFILSVLLISGSNRGEYALTSGLANIPTRLIFPIAIFVLLQKIVNQNVERKTSFQLGIVIALGVIEPPGVSLIAGMVAIFIIFLLSFRSQEVKRQLVYVVASTFGTLSTYLIVITYFFGRFDLDRYLFMINAVSKAENSMNYQTSMPMLGFHVVVFSCLTSCAFIGLRVLINSFREKQKEMTESTISSSLCTSFFGLFGLICSLQFSSASVYPFVLQFLLFWTALAMWGMISLTRKIDWSVFFSKPRRIFQQANSLSFLALALIPILSISQMPNPISEIRRISGSETQVNDRWTANDLRDNLRGRKIQELVIKYSGESLGYFGHLGNSTERVFGIDNYLGISSPESLFVNSEGRRLGCAPLLTDPPEILIVAWTEFPCPGYVQIETYEESFVSVFRKIKG